MYRQRHNTLFITTDFGDNLAPAQLHAVIDSLGFEGKIINNHTTEPFNVKSGAFEMLLLSRFAPENSVHLGVIDPGVGSERAGIVIKSKNFWFVGPDNGLLHPAANENGIEKVWKLNEKSFPNVTKTFHGRDVFMKSAGHLAMGKEPEDFGSTLIDKSSIVSIEFSSGEIMHKDAYGNIKIYWDGDLPIGKKLKVKTNGKSHLIPIVNIFNDVAIGRPLAFEGSSRTLELAVNQGSFVKKYGIGGKNRLEISVA